MKKILAFLAAITLLFGMASPASASPVHTPFRVKQAVVAVDPLSCGHGGVEMSWSTTKTYAKPSSTALTNWCLQNGAYDTNRRVLWQYDGNLTVRQGTTSGEALYWHANTQGRGQSLRFNEDSRIQILDASGAVIWQMGVARPINTGTLWKMHLNRTLIPPTMGGATTYKHSFIEYWYQGTYEVFYANCC